MKAKNINTGTGLPDRKAWLEGGEVRCSAPPSKPRRAWRVCLLGAPGVGKGTQASLLSRALGACHLSTGDVFRASKFAKPLGLTPALAEAQGCMSRGELVPDEAVLKMIGERRHCLHCGGGFLLDGFPRTVRQAQALQNLLRREELSLDAVVNYELDLDATVERLSGRRSCPT